MRGYTAGGNIHNTKVKLGFLDELTSLPPNHSHTTDTKVRLFTVDRNEWAAFYVDSCASTQKYFSVWNDDQYLLPIDLICPTDLLDQTHVKPPTIACA